MCLFVIIFILYLGYLGPHTPGATWVVKLWAISIIQYWLALSLDNNNDCHVTIKPNNILSALGSSPHGFHFPQKGFLGRVTTHTYISHQFTTPI